MSLTRRLINLARANLNALLERVGEEYSPLEHVTDEELEAELLRRKARREREEELRRLYEAHERVAAGRAAVGAASPEGGDFTSKSRAAMPQGEPGIKGQSDGRAKNPPSTLAQYYAQLEVPVGADFNTVKASYRRLMRKYHPDRFQHDPSKAAMATELTQKLSEAYRAIEKWEKGKRPSPKRM